MAHIQLRLFAYIEDPALRRAFARSLGFEHKRLLAQLDPPDLALARMLARLGLAAQPTLKWGLVTAGLHLPGLDRRLLARLRRG